MQPTDNIFDRDRLRQVRGRVAAEFADYDFLKRHVAENLVDRLLDIRRDFPLALELGAQTGQMARALEAAPRKIGRLIQVDSASAMLDQCVGERVVADDEALPFAADTFDAVIGGLSLHWVNRLPQLLEEIREMLQPDGLCMLSCFGGETLRELRQSMAFASSELGIAMHPRLSPMIDIRDAGALLQRAGFALPVVDNYTVTVTYADAFALMKDLRGMGETNMLMQRPRYFTRKSDMAAIAAMYSQHFALADGRIPATFDILTLTAWSPHSSQQQPSRRGSGQKNLGDVLS